MQRQGPLSVLKPYESPTLVADCIISLRGTKDKGTLIITNSRLVFVTSNGLISKTYNIDHWLSINTIRNARLESRLFHGQTLVIDWQFEDREGTYRYENLSNPEKWRDQILKEKDITYKLTLLEEEITAFLRSQDYTSFSAVTAIYLRYFPDLDVRDARTLTVEVIQRAIGDGKVEGVIDHKKQVFISKAKLDRERIVKEYKIDVDFSHLINEIENKGLVLQVLECPHCSGRVSVPKNGKMFECEFCKKNILVTDVFEKYKKILDL